MSRLRTPRLSLTDLGHATGAHGLPPGAAQLVRESHLGEKRGHRYGELLDLLMCVPEGRERTEALGRAAEVLAGRRPVTTIADCSLSHEPALLAGLDQRVLRASRSCVQFMAWAHAGLVLERPRGSQWHDARDAAAAGTLAVVGYGPQTPPAEEKSDPREHAIDVEGVFLVEHDWSAALRADEGGEVRWPYPTFVLELRLSGQRVCALMIDPLEVDLQSSRSAPYMLLFVETLWDGWALPCTFDLVGGKWQRPGTMRRHPLEAQAEDALLAAVAPQLRAVCIALDAEVVEREVVRAPERLNHARERRGRGPISDYTVLNLARRHRADRASERASDEKRSSPRLHFRRGHWRHYDARRVWINWQLVGDPDLGFVDKHYRL